MESTLIFIGILAIAAAAETTTTTITDYKDREYERMAISWWPYNNSETDHCKWNGITCDDGGRVAAMNIQGCNRTDRTWRRRLDYLDVVAFPYLNRIHLSRTCGLDGEIPFQIGYLFRLTYLNLSGNHLSHELPSSLPAFTKLQLGYLSRIQPTTCVSAKILSEIRHRSIVKLFGFCLHNRCMFLIYDYMERGSLFTVLIDADEAMELDWVKRVNVVKAIADALSYMHHDCSPPILHRDISSSNILLNSKLEACVSDFGTARLLDPEPDPARGNSWLYCTRTGVHHGCYRKM